MDNVIFKDYLAKVDQACKAGNATEHTHRPALKTLLEAFQPGVVATNEPKRIRCGAPDYIITRSEIPVGFVEAKDIGNSLDDTEKNEQLKRYRESLANLILTDYLEFRWYVLGKLRLTARLAKTQTNGKLRMETDGARELSELLQGFFAADIPVISSPRELAERMAALARLIRLIIGKTFAEEGAHGTLHEQMEGFRKVLLHDLTAEQFADMYAQTICYGLFAARCNSVGVNFTRTHAAYDLPKTNPFLRQLFGHIAGPELDDRIVWAVDNLTELLKCTDMTAILKDFGSRTRQEDPVVHFYETFLGAYDPKMREARGVYYTPEPVVSYIVRSVDAILKKDFNLRGGLADAGKIKLKRPTAGRPPVKSNKKSETEYETFETHKVQILDPATGTGTFLHGVIGNIHETFAANKGMWAGYVKENLLPRVYGFELLMAPYAVAHMKLGLLLRDTGYDFSSDERLRVFLTNTLEEAHEFSGLPLFTQWLAEEANSANKVKKEAPVMVVLGNPPYSGHSANTGEWIAGLLRGKDSSTRWSREDAWRTVNDFASLPVEEAREKYDLGKDSQDWKIAWAQTDLKKSFLSEGRLAPVLYRPFDVRHTYYTGKPSGFHCRPRGEVMRQMLAGKNLGLATTRSTEIERGWEHLFCTNSLLTHHTVSMKEVNYLFPLYLYSATEKPGLFDDSAPGNRCPNLAPGFIANFSKRLKLDFVLDGNGDLRKTFGPEDIFHYAYAVFHSPTYRARYAEFLKIDFPRLPLTSDARLFSSLCALGKELVTLHLMEELPALKTRYPVAGDSTVENVRYTDPDDADDPLSKVPGRVYINKTQYFDNVPPEVWEYHIGGYQVCHKWLKDRKGRQLSYDDLTHYRGIVAALARTIELQDAIDEAIGEWPLR